MCLVSFVCVLENPTSTLCASEWATVVEVNAVNQAGK